MGDRDHLSIPHLPSPNPQLGVIVGSRYHVKIDGQGYLIREGSYRRTGGDGGVESRRWEQKDWRGGCGWPLDGKGKGWYRGAGVEIGGEGRLMLGAALNNRTPTGEPGALVAMCPFGGYLYGVSGASSRVRSYSGAGWDVAYDVGGGMFRSLGAAFGELMAGNGNGEVYSLDMGTWGPRYTLDAGRPVTAILGCGVWNSTDRKTVPRVAVALSRPAGPAAAASVRILTSDAVSEHSLDCGEPVVATLAEYRGRLYIATSRAGWGVGGRLLCFDASSGTREGVFWEVASFLDGNPECMAASDGLLWIGLSNGRVMATDGVRMVAAVDLAQLGYAAEPVKGMADFGGRLFCCFADVSLGACLLSRLPANMSGASTGLTGAAEGWALSSYTGGVVQPAALAVHQGAVIVAASDGASVSFRRDPATAREAGHARLGMIDGGDGGAIKRLGRVLVNHDELMTGACIRVWASLEDPEGPWIQLGVAEATTGWSVWTFPEGTLGRLVWLKLEMESAGGLGPMVRGVVLEYGELGSDKRRWEMEVRCEGVTKLPLRLLDNTLEVMSGLELSEALWAASSRGAVTFEDVDGATRNVRVVSIEESLGKLLQEHGPQTTAKVRLIER